MSNKNITFYVKSDDIPTFERAEYFAGKSLSVVIAGLLREWVAVKEAEAPKCPNCGHCQPIIDANPASQEDGK